MYEQTVSQEYRAVHQGCPARRGEIRQKDLKARFVTNVGAQRTGQEIGQSRVSEVGAPSAPATIKRAPSVAPEAPRMIRTLSPPMQPLVPEPPPRLHKYQVGETVFYTSPSFGRAAATGSYTVVKLLPSEGDDYQYRIKSSGEAFERVAKESQLDKA